MKISRPLSFLLLFSALFSANQSSAQQSANSSLLNQFIQEVYANCPEYQDDLRIERGLDCLQRTIIHAVEANQYPECPLLSTASKKNKCNPTMDYSVTNFSPETFNPLKYQFQYNSSTPSYFRVDGTNYIIEIRPKN